MIYKLLRAEHQPTIDQQQARDSVEESWWWHLEEVIQQRQEREKIWLKQERKRCLRAFALCFFMGVIEDYKSY
jgi:hypothetical protein